MLLNIGIYLSMALNLSWGSLIIASLLVIIVYGYMGKSLLKPYLLYFFITIFLLLINFYIRDIPIDQVSMFSKTMPFILVMLIAYFLVKDFKSHLFWGISYMILAVTLYNDSLFLIYLPVLFFVWLISIAYYWNKNENKKKSTIQTDHNDNHQKSSIQTEHIDSINSSSNLTDKKSLKILLFYFVYSILLYFFMRPLISVIWNVAEDIIGRGMMVYQLYLLIMGIISIGSFIVVMITARYRNEDFRTHLKYGIIFVIFNGYVTGSLVPILFLFSLIYIVSNFKHYINHKELYKNKLKLYTGINLLMLFVYHPVVYFILALIIGINNHGDTKLEHYIFMGIIGSAPNLIIMIIGILMTMKSENDYRAHLFIGLAYSFFVIFGYVVLSFVLM